MLEGNLLAGLRRGSRNEFRARNSASSRVGPHYPWAQQPAGNGIAYLYDEAGRLIEVDRKADCKPASQVLERTVYSLDGAGT